MSPVWDLTKLAANPLPRPLNELATRPELTSWLTRVFFSIILPGKTHEFGMRTYVRYPNSLAAFVELLVHLHAVGYPTHWLSDFVSIMLTDALTTDVALYQGKYPCPSSEMSRRVARRIAWILGSSISRTFWRPPTKRYRSHSPHLLVLRRLRTRSVCTRPLSIGSHFIHLP